MNIVLLNSGFVMTKQWFSSIYALYKALECSDRSKNIRNRFLTKFYIEIIIHFFSQLFFSSKKNIFEKIKNIFSKIFKKIEIFI